MDWGPQTRDSNITVDGWWKEWNRHGAWHYKWGSKWTKATDMRQQHNSRQLLDRNKHGAWHRVLARPKRQGAAPCSFVRCPVVFPQRPVIFREPFGFFGLLPALFWAWSCRNRPIKVKGGAIFVHHVVIHVGHRHHLGFTSQISAWEWGYANCIWRNVIFSIVYLESGAGIYEY